MHACSALAWVLHSVAQSLQRLWFFAYAKENAAPLDAGSQMYQFKDGQPVPVAEWMERLKDGELCLLQ